MLSIRVQTYEADVSCQATWTLIHWFGFVVRKQQQQQNNNKTNTNTSYTVSLVWNLIDKSILASYSTARKYGPIRSWQNRGFPACRGRGLDAKLPHVLAVTPRSTESLVQTDAIIKTIAYWKFCFSPTPPMGWDWLISIWLGIVFVDLHNTTGLHVNLWRQAQQATAGWLCSYLPPWKPAPCLGGALAWLITTSISGRPCGFSVQTGLNWSFSKKSRS